MSAPPAIHSQLLAAVTGPSVRLRVNLIIDSCILAVEDLASLDRSMYQRSQASEASGNLAKPTRGELEQLGRSVLDGVRKLVSYLGTLDSGSSDDDDDSAMDIDFDLGGGPAEPDDMTLSDDDIAGALDGLAPETQDSPSDQWKQLAAELTTLSYALGSQLKDFDQRFGNALESDRLVQALRALDDVGNSLMDGMFALMSTICEAYLDEFDRDQLLPGHRDTLGKALLVRRGLADLRQVVNDNNRTVQDPEASGDDRQEALDGIAVELTLFLNGEVFGAMRPADRLELEGFHTDIAGHTVKQGGLSCEGLDKYLDSLVSVSQRDVLIKHDTEVKNEIAELLEGVAPLIDISPHGAIEMLMQAFARAAALYGYRDDLDELLATWKKLSGDILDPDASVELGKQLAEIVGPAA